MEKKNNQKNEECPLCKVSEETVERLKKEEPRGESEPEEKPKKKSSLKFGLGFLALVLGLSGIIFYSNNNFEREAEVKNNLLLLPNGQKIEKQEAEKEAETSEEQNTQESQTEETNPEAVYAPDFSFQDAEGSEISLTSLRGNNILLVFWATWCGYCKKELPDLKNFVEKYGNEIIVLTVVNQESPEVVQKYIEQEEINFPVLIDGSGQIWNNYLVRGTPSHFLIDKEGKVVATIPGYATKENLDMMASLVSE